MFYIGRGTKLAEADFAHLADKHGLEEALIRTVNQVESAGKGIHSNGAVTALYEPHIAWRYCSGTTRDALAKKGLAYPKWKAGNYPKTSYARIDQASAIAGEELAALATSWGLGQIMGFNHKAAGYPTAVAMVKAFAESEAKQLDGMINFIKSNPRMLTALEKKNWNTFASLYNGPAYKKNNYHVKLQAAYAAWSKKIASRPKVPVVLPFPKPVVANPTPQPEAPTEVKPPVKTSLWEMIVAFFKGLRT